MNIFVVDADPFVAAQNLCDAHVVKMIVESCQLLSTQDRINGLYGELRYKETHIKHPCRKCLDNRYNYTWLCYHLGALLAEYTYRYGKTHKCGQVFQLYWELPGIKEYTKYPNAWLCDFCEDLRYLTLPQCMPEQFKNENLSIDRTVEAYRKYYRYKRDNLKRFKYTKREPPEWLD